MITPKLSSKKPHSTGLFRSVLAQQSAFVIVTTILLFIIIVVPYLVDAPDHSYLVTQYNGPALTEAIREYYADAFVGIYYNDVQPGFVGSVLAVLAFASALSSLHFLHSKKMTDLYHSLPVRREKYLVVHAGVTMLAILGPYLVISLLTMIGQQAVYGRYGWVNASYFQYMTMDLFTMVVLVWAIYALTVFVAVNVGTTFDSLAVSGTLMFLPTAVYVIGGGIWSMTAFGAEFNGTYALRLSPFLFFFDRFAFSLYSGISDASANYSYIMILTATWLVIGCLLYAAAFFCYGRRKSEIAEQTQPSGVFQMIVKLFAVLCGSTLFLALFNDRSMPTRLIALVLGGIGIGLIAELILARGIRSAAKNLKWLAVAGVVYGLLYIGVTMDLFGYEKRIPAASSVASVTVSYRGQYSNEMSLYELNNPYDWQARNSTLLEDPASIEIVRETHQSLLNSRDFVETTYSGGYLRVQYRLNSGVTMNRYYPNVDTASYTLLSQLEDKPEFITKNNPLFFMDAYAQQPGVQLAITADAAPVISNALQPMKLEGDALNRLITALQSDALRQPLDEILSPTSSTQGYIRLTYRDLSKLEFAREEYGLAQAIEEGYDEYSYSYKENPTVVAQYWIPVTSGYTETLALLKDLKLEHFLTPDMETVSQVRIADLYEVYRYYNADQVVRIMPEGPNAFYWKLEDDENSSTPRFAVTDPAQIQQFTQKGISTMFLNRDAAMQIVAVQYFDEKGNGMAVQLMRLEDLPSSIRSQVSDYLTQQSRLEEEVINIEPTYAY